MLSLLRNLLKKPQYSDPDEELKRDICRSILYNDKKNGKVSFLVKDMYFVEIYYTPSSLKSVLINGQEAKVHNPSSVLKVLKLKLNV